MSSEFCVGQRWVSNTESELGLGIIAGVEDRRIELSFPAAGERRTYAFNNAPLSRVIYHAGEQIKHEDGRLLTISEVHEHQNCMIYLCAADDGEEVMVPELDLDCFVQFSKPQDRLFAGQIDKLKAFQLRCQTLVQLRHWQQSSVTGLLGARIQLLPHQLYIAQEVGSRYAPRVLLADEVGLGKTIEAGLVIHQQLLMGRAQRVMIVVPDSLLHQWLVEMLRRFNLHFSILDEERCQALESSSEGSPFDSAQLVLCKLSLFTEQAARLEQAVAADWDLLVVDEAHHLAWQSGQVSDEYAAIEALSQRARGLLLLTATPEQLGVESHFARLRLLDPDRYHDLQGFIDEESSYQPVNALIQQLLEKDASQRLREQPQLLEQMRGYLGDSEIDRLQGLLQDGQNLDLLIAELVRDILDRHGTGRVLFRNTRASVTGFPERCLQQYPLEAPVSYLERRSETNLTGHLEPELLLGDEWWLNDSRVDWLIGWLRQNRAEKVLLICASADTALDLEAYLRLRKGVTSAVFHEGLSLLERDRAAAYFADEEEGAQLLICSEIGSEGRNFQFARHLVLFDLPLNPDLLEQRIGRLDRIGQRHNVQLHVPFYRQSAQSVLLAWYHQGINAFEQTCPAGGALYQQFAEPLRQCMLMASDEAALEQLLEVTTQQLQQTQQLLEQGRDRLLELNSCDTEQAAALVAEMQQTQRSDALSDYMEQVFDQFGVDQEHHSATSVVLRPSDHMVAHSFPALPDDGVTVTYEREMALSRDDISYLSWEHPMVRGAMDMVLSGEYGNTALCTVKLPPLKPGSLLLETIFTVHCPAPAYLQLQRYLPTTVLRVVVNNDGKDLTKVLTTQLLDKLGQKVPRRNAQDMVRHVRSEVNQMISRAEKLAAPQLLACSDDALEKMHKLQQSEIKRMQALRKANPNIRQEEIDYLQQVEQSLHEHLTTAQLKLDAIRVAVVVN